MIINKNKSIHQEQKTKWKIEKHEFNKKTLDSLKKIEEKYYWITTFFIYSLSILFCEFFIKNIEDYFLIFVALNFIPSMIIAYYLAEKSPLNKFLEKEKTLKIQDEIKKIKSLKNWFPELTQYFQENIQTLEKIYHNDHTKNIIFKKEEQIPFEKMKIAYNKSKKETTLTLFMKEQYMFYQDSNKGTTLELGETESYFSAFSVILTKIPGEDTHQTLEISFSEKWTPNDKEKYLKGIEKILIFGIQKITDSFNEKEQRIEKEQNQRDLLIKQYIEKNILNFEKLETSKRIQKIINESIGFLKDLPDLSDKNYSDAKQKTLDFFENLSENSLNIDSEKISILESYRDIFKKYTLLFSLETPKNDTNKNLEKDTIKHLTEFLITLHNTKIFLSEKSKHQSVLDFQNTSNNTFLKSLSFETNTLLKIHSPD